MPCTAKQSSPSSRPSLTLQILNASMSVPHVFHAPGILSSICFLQSPPASARARGNSGLSQRTPHISSGHFVFGSNVLSAYARASSIDPGDFSLSLSCSLRKCSIGSGSGFSTGRQRGHFGLAVAIIGRESFGWRRVSSTRSFQCPRHSRPCVPCRASAWWSIPEAIAGYGDVPGVHPIREHGSLLCSLPPSKHIFRSQSAQLLYLLTTRLIFSLRALTRSFCGSAGDSASGRTPS